MSEERSSAAVGWITFAAIMLIMIGQASRLREGRSRERVTFPRLIEKSRVHGYAATQAPGSTTA